MKQIIYICDKCKKTVDIVDVVEFEDGIDFCPECWAKAEEMIKAWAREPEPAAAPEPKQEKPKAEKKPEKKPPVKKKAEIDAGKAQALRDAGWTITKIAEEMGTSKTMIHSITHKPAEKKRFENEWTEHEPDLSTQTRIDMGEKHLEDA